jgi:hypothetical protein
MLSLGDFVRSISSRDKPDDVGELEAAIARLEAERAAAGAELTAIAERRPTLLLSDDDKKLDLDERAAERAYRAVEKVDLVLPGLRDRLSAARNASRRDWEKDLTARCDATLAKYLTAFGTAVEVGEALAALRMEGQSNGFMEQMASILPAEPRVLNRDSLGFLAKEVERRRAATQPRPAPQPRPAVPPPAPKPATTANAKPARVAAPKPAPAPAPPAPFVPTPGEDGLFRVRILKDGTQAKRNEILALPRDEAFAIVQRAVGEFEEFLK